MKKLYYTKPESTEAILIDKIYPDFSSFFNDIKDVTVLSIFNCIPTILKALDMPTEYFDIYMEAFTYETTFDIYHDAILALKKDSKKKYTSMRNCIRSRTLTESDNLYTLEQKISNAKKDLLNFANKLSSYNHTDGTFSAETYVACHAQKFKDFYDYFHTFLPLSGKKFAPFLNGMDLVFNLDNYKKFIFHPQNFIDGIQFYNCWDIVGDYLIQHTSPVTNPSFKDEYSAYLFEQLHYPIQYLRCVGSYAIQDFASDKYPEAYFPMLLYTKLFDTHNLSLTDFIFNKYTPSISTSFYNKNIASDELRYYTFFEMQLYNTILIPLATSLIKKFLYNNLNGNLEAIKDLSQQYLIQVLHASSTRVNRNHTMPVPFYSKLADVHKQVKNGSYPGYNKVPFTQQNLKNTSAEYLFNHHISLAFFTGDVPAFFYYYQPSSNPASSLNLLRQRLANYYVMWENHFSHMTLDLKILEEKKSVLYKDH